MVTVRKEGWIKKIKWAELIIGIVIGVLGIAGGIYALGRDNANFKRDVQTNARDIQLNKEGIGRNANRISNHEHDDRAETEVLKEKINDQQAALAKIQEGVDWIKKDLEKR